MKRKMSLLLLVAVLFQFPAIIGFSCVEVSAKVSGQQTVLKNDDVLQMIKSGLSESLIIAKIKSSKGNFDTSPATLQTLKKAGVSDGILLAMVQSLESKPASATNNLPQNATEGIVPDGTEVKVTVTEQISGKTAAEGDPLSLKVAEDVLINGKVVIAKDTIAKGIVTEAKKSGRMGKGGSLSIRVESTQLVDGQKVKLRAAKGGDGNDKTGTTVALTVLFGPIGLLKKGKDAVIKAGTVISAFTDEAKTLN